MQIVRREPRRGRQAARGAAARDARPRRRVGDATPTGDERRADPRAQPVRLGDRPAQRGAAASCRLAATAAGRHERSDQRADVRRREGPHHRGVVGSGVVVRGARAPGDREERPSSARRRGRRQDGEVRRLGSRVARRAAAALPGADVQARPDRRDDAASRRRRRRPPRAAPAPCPTTSRRASSA